MITIGNRKIGQGHPAYIIAEVGSNFDGSLERAKSLAMLAKECGADAYKIQNFLAPKIVSPSGFKNLQVAFQAKWQRPVVEVYKAAEFPREWVEELSEYCREIGIDFFSSPYDTEAVDLLEKIGVPAHKIGAGEIDNLDFLRYVAKTQKPVILSCGATTMEEITLAVEAIRSTGNDALMLLQCVTNYPSPVGDANLRAMVTLKDRFGVEVGYSDHTISPAQGGDDPLYGLTVPLGAVALGASLIEKHFTDDRTRSGPDHPFAMEPKEFKAMVSGIRAMEQALGDGVKKVEPSEEKTVIIQRRGLYATRDIKAGEKLSQDMFVLLRPAVGVRAGNATAVLSKKARRDISSGEPIGHDDLE